MRFKTDKILGGFNIGGIKFGKQVKTEAKIGNIQMTGVYSNVGQYASEGKKSSFDIPQGIADKYASVVPPKGKPTQLVIDDAYYIPDKEFSDAEV